MKPTIWQFWQGPKPPFIELCLETVKKNNVNFQHVVLDENSVFDYLPDLRKDLDLLPRIANKADYIRFRLLKEYGGIWLDADVVLFKDLKDVYERFEKSHFDFSATSHFGLGKPSIWLLMSKKKSSIVDFQVMSMDSKLNSKKYNIAWSGFGAHLLWNFTNQNNYLHLEVEKFCPIPYNEYRIYFQNTHLDLSENYTFVFFNEMLNREQKHFLKSSKQQILNSPLLISQIFQKALNS